MELQNASLQNVLHLAKQLTPIEKVQLIEKIVPDLEAHLEVIDTSRTSPKLQLRSVYGLCADLGPAPSAEDIDDIRREIFENFAEEKNKC